MLTVVIPAGEYFNELTQEFVNTKECTLQLEHSLVSLSKWEAEKAKPFLSKTEKTVQETYDYVRCMTLTQNVDPNVYSFIPPDVLEKIRQYIEAPMTATTFYEPPQPKTNRETITAEVIYYWMVTANIPFECQKWHLNRLFALIRVCNIKNNPKKMSQKEALSRQRRLNAERKRALNTKG